MNKKPNLSLKEFLYIWLPLLGSWWMMAVEGPFLTSLVARLDNPKENLAAFGVAFSLAWLFESPIVMMMTASLRLVKNKQNFYFLRKFNYIGCAIITLIMILSTTSVGWNFLAKTTLNLNDHVSEIAWLAMVTLIPWPAFIGYRRFYQGIIISFGKSGYLLYGTIIRVIAMFLFAYASRYIDALTGIQKVTIALSGGVFVEAIVARILVRPFLVKLKERVECKKEDELNLKEVMSFYTPLAATAMMSIAVQPLVTASVNYGSFPLKSLAALPVINAFVFIFKCFPLSLVETYISLIEKAEDNIETLKKYTNVIVASMSVFLIIFVASPLYELWFVKVNGLSPNLINFAHLALAIIIWQPIISVYHSFNRSIAIHYKKTKFISNATFIELGLFAGSLTILMPLQIASAITTAMSSLLIGRLISAIYLYFKVVNLRNENQEIKKPA